MNRSILLLIGMLCALGTERVASAEYVVQTPGPPYPVEARNAKVSGSGRCQVQFDGSGRVSNASMRPSTGSKLLDENTLSFVRQHWTGHPNTMLSVPITYRLRFVRTKDPIKIVHVTAVKPPYPYEARAAHLEGSGMVRVTFDETGKVASVTTEKSTGSDLLDQNSLTYVRDTWYSSGQRNVTLLVPIIYRLHYR